MSDTVFILGAGASNTAGVPLMKDFLDTAHYLWKTGEIMQDAEDSFQKVFDGISQLQLVHSKSQLDIQNVESVFAAFEMGRTLKRFGDYSSDQIEELFNAMRQVIVKTIEITLKLPLPLGRRILPAIPEPYQGFMGVLNYLQSTSKLRRDISIITFNYDMAIDYSFHDKGLPLDYSLGGNEGGIPVLKLHGSLNWARCSVCGHVIPWPLRDYFKKYNWDPELMDNTMDNAYTNLLIGSRLNSFTHCEKNVHQEPVIVPPTWNKMEYHQTLWNVWSRAARELSNAENIFVIGYSLPPSDTFFRYLYALGTVGKTPLKRFWVFNPDISGETELRFRNLLGPGADARFQYFGKTFQDSLHTIQSQFPKK